MGRLVVSEHVSLDGVMQAPGRPGEDDRGGFDRGGWGQAYNDEVLGREMGKGMSGTGGMLLGRRTFEDFADFWPKQQDNPYTDVLNRTRKYVVSTSLRDPSWENSTVLGGLDEAADLLAGSGPDLTLLGSGELLTGLREHDLVDRYTLIICPLVLGRGRRLFPDGAPAAFTLASCLPTTTGAIIATYERS